MEPAEHSHEGRRFLARAEASKLMTVCSQYQILWRSCMIWGLKK